MTFGGEFRDSLVVEQLDKLSVSFLVDELEIRRGGVAPNMCFGLGMLGLSPVLVGAAGDDFADYRSWLERHGVDCSSVRISETRHTARFVCTTDSTMAQFASFYPGAMSEARLIELKPIADRVGEPTFVLIAADDPDGMIRHTSECRQRGYRVHRRPEPAARVQRGRADPRPDRRSGVPVLQRVRVPHDRVQDRLVRRRGARPGRRPGHHPRQGRRPHPPAGGAGHRRCRPRRTCTPSSPRASATRSARGSWPPSSGAWVTSGPLRSAACWRRTSWRRWAPRSTTSRPRSSSSASRTSYGVEAATDLAPHLT